MTLIYRVLRWRMYDISLRRKGVVLMYEQTVEGMQAAGVQACAKHFRSYSEVLYGYI